MPPLLQIMACSQLPSSEPMLDYCQLDSKEISIEIKRLLFKKNPFENFVTKIVSILSQPQCVKMVPRCYFVHLTESDLKCYFVPRTGVPPKCNITHDANSLQDDIPSNHTINGYNPVSVHGCIENISFNNICSVLVILFWLSNITEWGRDKIITISKIGFSFAISFYEIICDSRKSYSTGFYWEWGCISLTIGPLEFIFSGKFCFPGHSIPGYHTSIAIVPCAKCCRDHSIRIWMRAKEILNYI